jgi:acetyltransferase-like isoleucine patch superfamily enzyme
MIIIDPSAKISPMADIEDSIKGTRIIIGKYVTIDSFVKIKPAGGLGDLIIEENTVINSGCVFYTGNGVKIGKNSAIAANCTFAPVNHQFVLKDVMINQQGFMKSKGGILIEDDVWIGANCVILDGSIVERGVVVGAGSVVRGRLISNGIYLGNPLRLIGNRK